MLKDKTALPGYVVDPTVRPTNSLQGPPDPPQADPQEDDFRPAERSGEGTSWLALMAGLAALAATSQPATAQSIPSPYDEDYLQETQRFLQEMIELNQRLNRARPTRPQPPQTRQRGDLRVVAGQRSDGVKPSQIVIHEKGDWSSRQRTESYGYPNFLGQFQNGKLGSTYQVTVMWEDGTTTVRDVRLSSPDQTIFIDSFY